MLRGNGVHLGMQRHLRPIQSSSFCSDGGCHNTFEECATPVRRNLLASACTLSADLGWPTCGRKVTSSVIILLMMASDGAILLAASCESRFDASRRYRWRVMPWLAVGQAKPIPRACSLSQGYYHNHHCCNPRAQSDCLVPLLLVAPRILWRQMWQASCALLVARSPGDPHGGIKPSCAHAAAMPSAPRTREAQLAQLPTVTMMAESHGEFELPQSWIHLSWGVLQV
jgi:hypothetical protein